MLLAQTKCSHLNIGNVKNYPDLDLSGSMRRASNIRSRLAQAEASSASFSAAISIISRSVDVRRMRRIFSRRSTFFNLGRPAMWPSIAPLWKYTSFIGCNMNLCSYNVAYLFAVGYVITRFYCFTVISLDVGASMLEGTKNDAVGSR